MEATLKPTTDNIVEMFGDVVAIRLLRAVETGEIFASKEMNEIVAILRRNKCGLI